MCAAAGGARVTSLDLSKKDLEWGKRNFTLNDLDPSVHEFIFGDAFAWFRGWQRGRLFDVIIVDPPTFSRSKEHGVFQADKDYGMLAAAALPLLRRDGILLASTNAAALPPERFLEMVTRAITRGGPACHASTLRSAAAGFSGASPGAGLLEDRLAASWLTDCIIFLDTSVVAI